jgi:hypothetical protein
VRLSTWLRNYWRWLRPAWPHVLTAIVPVLPLYPIWVCTLQPERWLVWWGLCLELFGFVLAWLELNEVLSRHKRPGFRERFRTWRKARPRGKPIVISASAALSAGAALSATLSAIYAPRTDTLEERVGALEKNVKVLRAQLDASEAERKKQSRDFDRRLKDEKDERERAHSELRDRLTEEVAGGADFRFRGIVWVCAGTVFSNGAQDIGDVLRWLFVP